MQNSSNNNKIFLLLTLILILVFSTNVFSESAVLYDSSGNKVNYGWNGFWYQHHTTPNPRGDQNFLINYDESWDYSDFNAYSIDKISKLGGNHFYRCDSSSNNYTEFNVDVLKNETIIASYDQFKVVSSFDSLGCNKKNSSLPDDATYDTWQPKTLTFNALGQNDTNIYAQPNNFSSDYDCDMNKFWIQFYLDSSNYSNKFICDDDPAKVDTCIKEFTATKSGVWKVRFGNGIVYESIHCNSSDDQSSPDYNTIWFERKWGINNWDISVKKVSGNIADKGRVWMPSWHAAGFNNKDVNFFILGSSIGNPSNCNWDKVLFGQESWSQCYSEYFQLKLKEFSLSWSSITTNNNGYNVYQNDGIPVGFKNYFTQKSLPYFAKIDSNVLATSKTFRQILDDMSREDYTGCGEKEYYFFNTDTINGVNRKIGPFVGSEKNQRLYFNEPEFSKKPGDYTPSVKVTEKIDKYIFDLNVGENVSKYYQVFIDVDKDGYYYGSEDFYFNPPRIINGSDQYSWDLRNNAGVKLSPGDYNYLFKFFSTITNIPVVGLTTKIRMNLSRPIGGELISDKLYWDDTEVGGQLNVVGSNERYWNGNSFNGVNCIDSRMNCFCLDRINGKITTFYDLNQSVGYHDAMNTWAYGDITEYKDNVRVIVIQNDLLTLNVSVVDENTINIFVDCTYDTTLNQNDLPKLYDSEGNEIGLTFIPPLDCKAGGSVITANINTPLLQDEVYSVSGSIDGCSDCGRDVYFNFDNPNKPKASIPDNNIFVVILLFVSVLFIISQKKK